MTKRRPAPRRRTPPPPPRKSSGKRKPSNLAAIGRRLFLAWPTRAVTTTVRAGARHGAATAQRATVRHANRWADRREERRVHGRRAVVRDPGFKGGSPLSRSQVAAYLLQCDQAAENAKAREEDRKPRKIEHAQVMRPRLTPGARARLVGPLTLTPIERMHLAMPRLAFDGWRPYVGSDGWGPEAIGRTHAAITKALHPPVSLVKKRPPTPPVPPPGGRGPRPVAGPGHPTPGGDVIEPSNIEDLANPGIDQSNWQEEGPQHTRAAHQLMTRLQESVQQYAQYHQQAQVRSDVQGKFDEFAASFQTAADQLGEAANAYEQWAAEIEVPTYDKAG